MSFNFSALQFERDFAAKNVCNWEYPRFSPPRPRFNPKITKPVVDKNGHLLPSAPREGHFLGHYRGTYHLPLKITRSFASLYNRCLSGQHKYAKYPKDLCCCQRERPRLCDFRETLGKKGDPLWQRPTDCQTKCEGLKQMLAINELHKKCKRTACQPEPNEKLIPILGDISSRYKKKMRKRQVTAFDYSRRGTVPVIKEEPKPVDKKKKKNVKAAATAGKEKSTAKSTTKAPGKSKSKTKSKSTPKPQPKPQPKAKAKAKAK